MNEVLGAALRYADNGWPVFPLYGIVNGRCECGTNCGSPGKHPRTKNGLYAASLEPQQIERWFTQWPNSNLAISTGATSGILVLDLDNKRSVELPNGEMIPEGEHSLATQELAIGTLSETMTSLTGSGGKHLIFTYPSGTGTNGLLEAGTIGNRSGVWPSVDVRGDGGYIVVPPSRHASGNRYRWLTDGLLPMPLPTPWVSQIVGGGSSRTSNLSLEPDASFSIREGEGRHEWLFKMGSKLRGQHGLPAVALYGALQAYNRAVCLPPLEAHEVEHIVESCGKFEPHLPPMQLDVTPPEILEGDDLAESLAEFLANEPAPFVPLVARLLNSQEVMVIGGQPNVGKTWVVMDMMLGIASGGTFADYFHCTAGGVLFIDEEGSRRGDWERLHMLLSKRTASASQLPIWSKIGAGLRIDDGRGAAMLARLIDRYQPAVVVMDSLVRMHGRDESNNREMANFFDRVKKLRDAYGCSFIFTHHVPKPPAQGNVNPVWMLRGAGDIQGFPDSVLICQPGEGNEMRVIHTKMRNGEKLPIFTLNLLIDKEDGTAQIGYLGEEQNLAGAMKVRDDMARILDQWDYSVEELAGHLGLVTRTAKQHVDVLVATGRIFPNPVVAGRVTYRGTGRQSSSSWSASGASSQASWLS